MQPVPTKTNVAEIKADMTPCYVWVHLPHVRGRIITGFNSIKKAYTYAETYVYEANARPAIHAESEDTVWTAATGEKWVSPGMTWNSTLSEIYIDIETHNKPKHDQWFCLSTNQHQIIIGLGQNLPPAYRLCMFNHEGFDVESHDTPDSVIYQAITPSMFVCANCQLSYPKIKHAYWWENA